MVLVSPTTPFQFHEQQRNFLCGHKFSKCEKLAAACHLEFQERPQVKNNSVKSNPHCETTRKLLSNNNKKMSSLDRLKQKWPFPTRNIITVNRWLSLIVGLLMMVCSGTQYVCLLFLHCCFCLFVCPFFAYFPLFLVVSILIGPPL